MVRMMMNAAIASVAVLGVVALAYAEETVIEKHSVESQHEAVEVAPPAHERRVEEQTIRQQPPTVKKETDTVVTHHGRGDDDNGNDND